MQTIGERLEEARKKKGISIREAAEATKIRGEYLQKFEGNQFEIGLTEIYTRGFLRGYANYLRIPSERLLNDYTALRGGEPRLRQPSREVYGRMDLAISTADERGEPQSDLAAPEAAQRPQARFQRPGENLPKGPPIDPALVFKGGIILASVIGALLIVWLIKSLVGSGSAASTRNAAPAGGEITESAPATPASTISVYALDAVRIKVARKSDDVELFQGSLQPGEHREFQNIPLYLTASDLGSVQLDYKGHRYPTGYAGYKRIQFDFSNR